MNAHARDLFVSSLFPEPLSITFARERSRQRRLRRQIVAKYRDEAPILLLDWLYGSFAEFGGRRFETLDEALQALRVRYRRDRLTLSNPNASSWLRQSAAQRLPGVIARLVVARYFARFA